MDLAGTTRIGAIIAPPGSGKTTLLGQLAGTLDVGVVPARFSASTADPPCALPAAMAEQWQTHQGEPTPPSVDAVLATVASAASKRFALFIDDADQLASEDDLLSLVTSATPNLVVVLASRTEKIQELVASRNIAVTRLGYDELRFTPAETAELLARPSGRRLTPEAAERLCERTEGWAVALRMFDADTQQLDEIAREAAAHTTWNGSPRLQQYVHEKFIDDLSPPQQKFLIRSSCTGLLDGQLCDAVLGTDHGAATLRQFRDNHRLIFPCDGSGTRFRYHSLLQHYCEQLLTAQFLPDDVRHLHRRAGTELVTRGHWAEAFRAFAHAEAWVSAAETLYASRRTWPALHDSALLPVAWFTEDPWVHLADARRLRGNGQFRDACDAYREAEARFTDSPARWRTTVERVSLTRWVAPADTEGLESADHKADNQSRYLRLAIGKRPAQAHADTTAVGDPYWPLVQGIAAALDGRVAHAHSLLRPLCANQDPFVSIASRITVAVIDSTSVEPAASTADLARLAVEAEAAGWLWLARLAHAATALADIRYLDDAIAIRAECQQLGDEWGSLLAGVAICMAAYRTGADVDRILRETIDQAHRLSTVTLETWLRLLLTAQLTAHNDPGALSELVHIQQHIADVQTSKAPVLTGELITVMHIDDESSDSRGTTTAQHSPSVAPVDVVELRCFGKYELLVAGQVRDLGKLRQQPRTLLWLLSIHVGKPLHQEEITNVLWPNVTFREAKHRLHVAVSSIRRAIDPYLEHTPSILVRDGRSYLLKLPPSSKVDLLTFETCLRSWRSRQNTMAVAEQSTLLDQALTAYRGELLVESGQAEWVLPERERLRTEAANAAAALARLQQTINPNLAIETCLLGLRIDQYHYGLWRLLAEAHTRTGNEAAALRARQQYMDLIST
ncbi:AAA family ATPase [Amycolatopsis sp. SID8362]|uniref:AAA family ATPase n=1 Tax=Amycolatopsis sp. SID8362 TaxID=2690346 RepID=UPI0013709127|nr:AAA family ATPase [Amycolatopsis sp. SID8362]NBH06064.1 hypothetical protein [Amycolatopsis sp. SID8362]NED42763.1 hypothetical protein [Amycolatopsis sp. SID8362]